MQLISKWFNKHISYLLKRIVRQKKPRRVVIISCSIVFTLLWLPFHLVVCWWLDLILTFTAIYETLRAQSLKYYILVLLIVLLRQRRCHIWKVSISCTSNCVRCEIIFKDNWGNRYWQVCTENVSTNRQFIFVTSRQFIMVENVQFWMMILFSRYLVMVICQTDGSYQQFVFNQNMF